MNQFMDLIQKEDPITEFRGEYHFLSNFYRQEVVFQGITYQSSEHAYQTQKCISPDKRLRVMHSESPGLAKRAGKRLLEYSKRDWNKLSIGIMTEIIRAKFSDPALRAKLLVTGYRELVEGNRWGDDFWGVVPGKGGRNQLGRILMQVREEIRQQ